MCGARGGSPREGVDMASASGADRLFLREMDVCVCVFAERLALPS